MWKFELLERPRLREQAAREAVEADWIIVAFANNSAPSTGLKHWLDSWEANASGKRQSLVALCVPTFIVSTEGALLMELCALAARIECSFQGPLGGPPDPSSENVRF